MQIRKFEAEGVHGYLNIRVRFFSDLTFLIGINGSGKTTVVRTIHALLAPILPTLAFTDYRSIALEIEHEGRRIAISTVQDEKGLQIRTSETADALFVPKFEMPATEPAYKFRELFLEHYRTQRSINTEHPVYVFLQSLPTPMYLGIERRVLVERETPFRPAAYRPARRRSIFAGSLAESLEEASELAAFRFRRIQESDDKLKDKLRNALLIRNFEFVDIFASGARSHKMPDVAKIKDDISRQRTNVKKALTSLGLSEQEIAPVDAFFGQMEGIVKALPSKSRHSNEPPSEAAQVTWVFNEWQFNKVNKLVQLVDKFVADSRALYAPIDRFLMTVNDFFRDSKKRIEINRFGMSVLIGDLPSRDLSSLSSGEQQLVVLLTHLAFNPNAAEANVLIIDEPELSLHIGWQEKFADALLKANPNIQFILATHSPAIVLDRDSKCRELPGS